MRRISIIYKRYNESTFIPQVGVEHISSRDEFPQKQLDYSNMVAVCNGIFGLVNHCDKTDTYTWQGQKRKGKMHGKVSLLKLYPTNSDCETLIDYNSNGLIKSAKNDEQVEEDIMKLNLNDEKIKGYRRNTIDAAHQRLLNMKKTQAGKTWNQSDFQKEVVYWTHPNKDNKLKPFCQIAIWYLKNERQKSIYQ